jgi:hypothetical protein
MLGLFTVIPLIGQDSKFSDMEKIQDDIENLYVKTYKIFETYPNLTYEYVYNEDYLVEVRILGVDDIKARKRLEVYMMDIADLKDQIMNETNRLGIYYVTETEPRPKAGYEAFYDNMKAFIDYPEFTNIENMEGTLYAKFVVNGKGEVNDVLFTSNFEEKENIQVERMKQDTEEAILATSGDWDPATIEGIPVSQWVVLPVELDLQTTNYPFLASFK